ncbi:activating signal cointegrator 1 complex subunit 2 [Biomphalaria pfeifferi]|uniref:Activating signal cointegrator 1 complex subunit 2 n=1 Tax=Biomphalaria pfeifferi TaxID=112525 RepID=A0AAD8C357_BIOPF|nr:activating signal cointegrator 1 complex subunit 2 [Biomphalaria pfeifferi]
MAKGVTLPNSTELPVPSEAVPAEITLHKINFIQTPLSALTTGQDKRGLTVVPELAITGQREHIGEHDVTLII